MTWYPSPPPPLTHMYNPRRWHIFVFVFLFALPEESRVLERYSLFVHDEWGRSLCIFVIDTQWSAVVPKICSEWSGKSNIGFLSSIHDSQASNSRRQRSCRIKKEEFVKPKPIIGPANCAILTNGSLNKWMKSRTCIKRELVGRSDLLNQRSTCEMRGCIWRCMLHGYRVGRGHMFAQ